MININKSYFCALLLFLLVSCAQEEVLVAEKMREIKTLRLYMDNSVVVVADSTDEDIDSITRSQLVISTSSWYSLFEKGDTIGFFPDGGYQIPFIPPLEEGETAKTVTIQAQGWMTKDGIMYAAYLPYNFYNRHFDKVHWSFFRKTPKQMANGSTSDPTVGQDHLGPYMFMATPVCPADDEGAIDANLYLKACVIRVRAKMPLGGTFTKMVLASSKSDAFITHGTLDMFSEGQPFTAKGYINYITLLLNNFEVASTKYITAYLVVPPTENLTGTDLTLYVWDSNGNCYSGSQTLSSSLGSWPARGYVKLNYTNLAADYNVPSVYLTPFEYEEELDAGVALED